MKTKGFKAYQMHNAFNLHFSAKSDYDYFRYNGKTSQTESSLSKSNNRYAYAQIDSQFQDNKLEMMVMFYRIWRRYNFEYVNSKQLLRSIRTLMYDEGERSRNNPKTLLNSFFEYDLHTLKSRYNSDSDSMKGMVEMFNVPDDSLYPRLYNDYEQGRIHIETLLLLDRHIYNVLNNDISSDMIRWKTIVSDMKRIQPFVLYIFDGALIKQGIESCLLTD